GRLLDLGVSQGAGLLAVLVWQVTQDVVGHRPAEADALVAGQHEEAPGLVQVVIGRPARGVEKLVDRLAWRQVRADLASRSPGPDRLEHVHRSSTFSDSVGWSQYRRRRTPSARLSASSPSASEVIASGLVAAITSSAPVGTLA